LYLEEVQTLQKQHFKMKKSFLSLLILLLSAGSVLPSNTRTIPEKARPVYTGMYLMNVYDLDVSAYTFYADFYVWFRWKGDRNPMNIEFVNAVEKWGFTQTPFYEEPIELASGYQYNGMRIEGRFYHSFSLSDFPLDRHQLDIRIEHVDYPQDSLVYLPDTATQLMREGFVIPGWKILGAEIATHRNFYQTSFGEGARNLSTYSNFTFELDIARPLSYFLLKLMLPLLVVILASLGTLLIHPQYLDARISLPIGGLLSVVFLQQSYSSALPDVGYMVLMDQIYLVSYLLIGTIMLRVIMGGNRLAGSKGGDLSKIRRSDRRRTALLLGVYLFLVSFLVLFS